MSYSVLAPTSRRAALAGLGALGDASDDLIEEAGSGIYQRFMSYAKPAVDDLVAEAIAQAEVNMDSIVGVAVDAASPKIRAVVLATATDALQSAALQELAATTKKQVVALFVISCIATVGGVALVLKKMR